MSSMVGPSGQGQGSSCPSYREQLCLGLLQEDKRAAGPRHLSLSHSGASADLEGQRTELWPNVKDSYLKGQSGCAGSGNWCFLPPSQRPSQKSCGHRTDTLGPGYL
jgi:hypothetical protein